MDPIDRAAVLDALDEQIKQCDRALNSFNISMKDEYAVKVERASLVAFRETLKYMPSVQPDIIACGDCKHYIPHNKRCGYWNHGVKPLEWCSQAERWWKE